jgi:AcrR family transcriptional regulator
MQHLLTIDHISTRAKQVGYDVKNLACAAGVAESTVYRAITGKNDLKTGTLRRLYEALAAHELALRDYLIGLHGLPSPPVLDSGRSLSSGSPEARPGGRNDGVETNQEAAQ